MGFFDSIIDENVIPIQKPKITRFRKDSLAYASSDINKKIDKTEDETLIKSIEADAWVYSAVYKLATSVARLPFKIFNIENDGSLLDITREPEFRVFINPNPWFTRFDFWEATTVYLESVGRCFWELVRDNSNNINEMYPLKPSQMEPVKDRKKFIVGWKYTLANGKVIDFEVEEVVFLRYFDPDNPYQGLSPLKAGANSVAIDIFSQSYSLDFFKNSGRPDGILTYDSELNDDDYDRIRTNWDKSHSTAGGKGHRVAIVEQGMDYKSIATTQKDADFIKQRKLSRDEILAVFGVPPATVGVFESAIKANAEVQERMFWTETMIPKLIKMAEMVRLAMKPMLDASPKYDFNRIFTSFDTSQVHILMEALREHEDKLIEHVKNGSMSRNEARQILNAMYGNVITLKDFDGGNKILLPNNVENEIGETSPTEAELNKSELKLIKQEEVEIEIPLAFTIESVAALEVLDVKPMLVKTSVASNERVRRIVSDGLNQGLDIKDMQDQIFDEFKSSGDFSINRTTTIARTETTQTANVATLDSYKQSKVVEEKEWLTSRDLKVRPATKFDKGDHRILDGESVKLDATFSNGLMYPGDQSGAPEENVNCRCTMLSKNIPGTPTPLATSSDNQIIKVVLWKKFVNETERFEKQIQQLFLNMFEDIGNRYIQRLNDFSINKNTIDLILLDNNAVAVEMEKRYRPLKEAIMKEYGQIQLSKLR